MPLRILFAGVDLPDGCCSVSGESGAVDIWVEQRGEGRRLARLVDYRNGVPVYAYGECCPPCEGIFSPCCPNVPLTSPLFLTVEFVSDNEALWSSFVQTFPIYYEAAQPCYGGGGWQGSCPECWPGGVCGPAQQCVNDFNQAEFHGIEGCHQLYCDLGPPLTWRIHSDDQPIDLPLTGTCDPFFFTATGEAPNLNGTVIYTIDDVP
jgi:hypothetical protein